MAHIFEKEIAPQPRMIFICRIVKKGIPFGRLHMVKDRYL